MNLDDMKGGSKPHGLQELDLECKCREGGPEVETGGGVALEESILCHRYSVCVSIVSSWQSNPMATSHDWRLTLF